MPVRNNIVLIAAAAATVILWGSAFVVIRIALREYSPFHLSLLRFLVASTVFLIVFFVKGLRVPKLSDFLRILAVGFIGIAAYNTALNYGQVTVQAGAASFIIGTTPLFTAILSSRMLGDNVNIISWLSMLISFTGVTLISIGNSSGLYFDIRALSVLSAALFSGFWIVFQKPLMQKYTPLEIASYTIWTGTLFLLVFSPGLVGAINKASIFTTAAVVYLGIFPGAIGFFTWSIVLSKLKASRAVTILYIVPVAATTIAIFLLGEIPTFISIIGGLLALGGVILMNTKGQKK